MAFGFTKQHLAPIGIDFGADSLKLLQVVPGDPPQLVAAGAAVIPEDVRFDAAGRSEFLADALRQMLRTLPLKGRRAVLSFPAFQTLTQHLEIGRAEGESVDDLVGQQLRAKLSIDPARMLIRSFPVRQFVRNGVNLQEVICLAAAREIIMGYIELANRCRLDVVGMHAEPVAVLRAFEHLYRSPKEEARVTCFIDIGAAMTKVLIAHGRTLIFAKNIHVGGDNMTRHLAQARSIGFGEAYRLRTTTPAPGIPAPGIAGSFPDTATAVLEPDTDTETQAAATDGETVSCIVEELQLCLRYHRSLFPDRPVEKLVFLGGEARQTELCRSIAKEAGVAAQLGDPIARVSRVGAGNAVVGLDLGRPQPGWAVPLGLSLCEPAV